jgi:hypothetical protein
MTPSCMSLDTDRTPDGLAHGDARLPSGDGREHRRLRSNCAAPEKAQPDQRVSTTLSSTRRSHFGADGIGPDDQGAWNRGD